MAMKFEVTTSGTDELGDFAMIDVRFENGARLVLNVHDGRETGARLWTHGFSQEDGGVWEGTVKPEWLAATRTKGRSKGRVSRRAFRAV